MTSEGRFVAGILMFAGVGLFGTFSGFLAAWFIGSGKAAEESELSAIRADLAAIRHALEAKGESGASPVQPNDLP